MILCLGSAADPTFLHLLPALRARDRTVAVDVVQLLTSGGFVLDADAGTGTLRVPGTTVDLDDVTGVWVRVPGLLHDGLDAATTVRVGATTRALAATLGALAARVPVVNPPAADPTGFSKPVHLLHLAAAAGLPVPATCVTNDPAAARRFVDAHDGDVVSKGVSSTKTWARAWDEPVDGPRLPLVRHTPVQLQRRVHGPDVRVHTAGDRLFAEVIRSTDVDYRRRRGSSTFAPVTCPPDVAAGCRTLVRLLGAPLLGVDFKVDTATGRWVLLEANTMPCVQGYDVRTGGAIGAAVADLLTAPGSAPRSSAPATGAGHAHQPSRRPGVTTPRPAATAARAVAAS